MHSGHMFVVLELRHEVVHELVYGPPKQRLNDLPLATDPHLSVAVRSLATSSGILCALS